MRSWESNITKNPLLFKFPILARRFFKVGNGPMSIKLGVGILGALYVAIFLAYTSVCGEIDPGAVPIAVAAILPLVAIFGFYGCIAGERERRTWELMRVAPLREGQIITAKFAGGLAVVSALWLLGIPFLIATFARFRWSHSYLYSPSWGTITGAYLSSLAIAIGVLGFTVFASSALRRPLNAFALAVGGTLGWLAGLPALLAVIAPPLGFTKLGSQWLAFACLNPFDAISEWLFPDPHPPIGLVQPPISSGAEVLWTTCWCLTFGILSLYLAKRFLSKVDRNEGRRPDA